MAISIESSIVLLKLSELQEAFRGPVTKDGPAEIETTGECARSLVSAMGQKQTSRHVRVMSVIPSKRTFISAVYTSA